MGTLTAPNRYTEPMIIHSTSIGGSAGARWLVKDASSQEIQSLVAFADKWWGAVDVSATNGNYELLTVSARSSAAADFFEMEFGAFIVKEEPPSCDEHPPSGNSAAP